MITTILLIVILVLLLINFYWVFRNTSQKPDTSSIENALRDEFSRSRVESGQGAKGIREEITNQMTRMSDVQSRQLNAMTDSNERKMDKLITTLEDKLTSLQKDNNKKLEEMRRTVDDQLQSTLEKRLGQSFDQVSKRLEEVHKGLGEMQNLATGVGDLKKVLSNVKARGIIGEYQLGNILEQILHRDQYQRNVKTKSGSNGHVEYAIKLPGHSDNDDPVWLPVDSKFPMEDYQHLVDAYEKGDGAQIEIYKKQLINAIKTFARDISDKYLDPPHTTDFGIMFVPVEGLYAEILRQPGVFEFIQRQFKIIITGPTTLAALLNSLQMGFRTLAIEKRSSEVWDLLGTVKTEFHKFGGILDKTKKKLQEASNVIDKASSKSRNIQKKLKNVQDLPETEKPKLIVNRNEEEGLLGNIAKDAG